MSSLDQNRKTDGCRAILVPRGLWKILVILGVLASSALSALAQPGNWQILQFPAAGADRTWCYGVNPRGDMVGVYRLSGTKGFLFSQGTYYGPLPALAHGINSRGDIVGNYGSDGFLLHDGVLTTLKYPGVAMTHPWDINPRGEIVGSYMTTTSSPQQGFLRSKDGTFTEIRYPGAAATVLYGISPQGDIAGEYWDGANKGHGFLRRPDGVFTPLDFPGATETSAFKVNARGDIIGYYWDSSSPKVSHGFLWRDGLFTTLDYPGATHTMIHGFNSEGEMCGMVSFTPLGSTPEWGGFALTW